MFLFYKKIPHRAHGAHRGIFFLNLCKHFSSVRNKKKADPIKDLPKIFKLDM
jgi:hypothetical protein